jgi:DNA repair exonuclease SbcCD ATPase subunit
MKEQTEETKKKTTEQASKQSDKKSLSGTEEEKQPAWWEKAAGTIAGDNKMLGTILRFVLSPLGILLGLGLIAFGLYKMKGMKDEIEKLKSENKQLKEDFEELEEEHQKTKKKFKKLKTLNEAEAESSMNGLLLLNEPEKQISQATNKKYQTAYL